MFEDGCEIIYVRPHQQPIYVPGDDDDDDDDQDDQVPYRISCTYMSFFILRRLGMRSRRILIMIMMKRRPGSMEPDITRAWIFPLQEAGDTAVKQLRKEQPC